MILDPIELAITEEAIKKLTGEPLSKGDTGWLGVIARALSIGCAYKAIWEQKYGQVPHSQVNPASGLPGRDIRPMAADED